MGEYAKYKGEQVKIGTCENMYYLRADQRRQVTALSGNVNPAGADRFEIRFRFPWPDEDGTEPGGFESYGRAVHIPGLTAPAEGVEHYSIQFVASAGYLTSLPCPETGGPPVGLDPIPVAGLTVHRNGFRGAVLLSQQKFLRDGRLVPILECGGCGTKWRVEDPAEIETVVVALRAEGDRRARDGHGAFWHAIADRVAGGARVSLT